MTALDWFGFCLLACAVFTVASVAAFWSAEDVDWPSDEEGWS
jgi:hypothetical protein